MARSPKVQPSTEVRYDRLGPIRCLCVVTDGSDDLPDGQAAEVCTVREVRWRVAGVEYKEITMTSTQQKLDRMVDDRQRRTFRENHMGPILAQWQREGRTDTREMARELRRLGFYSPKTVTVDIDRAVRNRLGL